MSMCSDEVRVEDSWKIDLEIALLEDADIFRIRSICANRPLPANSRPEVWRICLRPDLQREYATTVDFDHLTTLPNQDTLHADCANAAAHVLRNVTDSTPDAPHSAAPNSLSDSDDWSEDLAAVPDSNPPPPLDVLTADFESVLTQFAHVYNVPYDSRSGWTAICRVLFQVLRPADRRDLYTCFAAVMHRFVPTGPESHVQLATLFRLLLQYHDPALSRLLDSLTIAPDLYATPWLLSLFTESTLADEDVLFALWDVYFLVADPLLALFICLVLVLNAKSTLFPGSDEDTEAEKPKVQSKLSRDDALRVLLDLPKPLRASDLTSLVELTDVFSRRTPQSFRSRCTDTLFGNHVDRFLRSTDGLCLSVSVQDVLDTQASVARRSSPPRSSAASAEDADDREIRYLLVDCRPAEQYNGGHLQTAFFLDSTSLLSDPTQFNQTIKALLQSQKRALQAGSHAAGEHIALQSSGRPDEDRVANLVLAAFLRLDTPYVSLVEGGYTAVHEFLPANDPRLVSHDSSVCLCCARDKVTSPAPTNTKDLVDGPSASQRKLANHPQHALGNLLTKFSSSLFGTNQAGQSVGTGEKSISSKHSSPSPQPVGPGSQEVAKSRQSGSYRNTSSVFTIDDEGEEEEETEEEDGHVATSPSQKAVVQTPGEQRTPSSTEPAAAPAARKRAFWPLRWLSPSGTTTTGALPPGDSPTRPGGLDSSEPGDLIDTTKWSCRPEVRGVFDCQLVDSRGYLAETGYLVLVERHVLLLADHPGSNPSFKLSSLGSAIQSVLGSAKSLAATGTADLSASPRSTHAQVLRSVPLRLITRITANKRILECITFHYAAKDASDLLRLNEQVLGIRDRLYLPQADVAVRMIKSAICTVFSNPSG